VRNVCPEVTAFIAAESADDNIIIIIIVVIVFDSLALGRENRYNTTHAIIITAVTRR